MNEGVQVPKCLNLLEPGPGPASVGCACAASLFFLCLPYILLTYLLLQHSEGVSTRRAWVAHSPPLCRGLASLSARALSLLCFGLRPGPTWRGLAYSEQRNANTLFCPCTSWCQQVVCHPSQASPESVPPPNLRDPDCPTPLRAPVEIRYLASTTWACMHVYAS